MNIIQPPIFSTTLYNSQSKGGCEIVYGGYSIRFEDRNSKRVLGSHANSFFFFFLTPYKALTMPKALYTSQRVYRVFKVDTSL